MSTLANARLLVGRMITAVDLRPWLDQVPDGSGTGRTRAIKVYNPVFTLDNGARVTFFVAETEAGEYGVSPIYHSPVRSKQSKASGGRATNKVETAPAVRRDTPVCFGDEIGRSHHLFPYGISGHPDTRRPIDPSTKCINCGKTAAELEVYK
jgi:hypothetical protein